jgi:hypothetical protein
MDERMSNHEIVFPATAISGPVPQGVSIPLSNSGWLKLISAFYSFVITGSPGNRLFDLQVLDASGNILYQQRLLTGVPNPAGATPFVAQTIGGDQQELVDSMVTHVQLPSTLLVPPSSSLRVFVSSGIGPVTDTVAATIIAADA